MFAIEETGFKAVLSNNPDEIKAAEQSDFQEWERLVQLMKMLLESGLDSLIQH
jgi:glutamine amidotransferase